MAIRAGELAVALDLALATEAAAAWPELKGGKATALFVSEEGRRGNHDLKRLKTDLAGFRIDGCWSVLLAAFLLLALASSFPGAGCETTRAADDGSMSTPTIYGLYTRYEQG